VCSSRVRKVWCEGFAVVALDEQTCVVKKELFA
jgi:hypothetical protein